MSCRECTVTHHPRCLSWPNPHPVLWAWPVGISPFKTHRSALTCSDPQRDPATCTHVYDQRHAHILAHTLIDLLASSFMSTLTGPHIFKPKGHTPLVPRLKEVHICLDLKRHACIQSRRSLAHTGNPADVHSFTEAHMCLEPQSCMFVLKAPHLDAGSQMSACSDPQLSHSNTSPAARGCHVACL